MFYFLAIGAMLAYALQQTLLVHHARKVDGLSLAFYRNVSFGITLLPLLIGTTRSDIAVILSFWPLLLASGIAGGVYLGMIFASYKFLPAGIGTSVSIAVSTICIGMFGWVFLQESISPAGLALMAVILVGVLVMGVQHKHFSHLDGRFLLGIVIAAVGTVPVAFVKYALTVISREANPLASGYFWELSIGIGCLLLLLARSTFTSHHIQKISMRDFLVIGACSAPTLIGTGLFALAVSKGPIAIVGAIGSGSLVVTSLLAWLWYREKLSMGQWAAMALIIAGVIGLKFV
ncbi:DMT family transporter [Candidatus Peribacteria bacterium]|nr:DMT family transporter [Candidatus Peribacteria bacterium]